MVKMMLDRSTWCVTCEDEVAEEVGWFGELRSMLPMAGWIHAT